MKSPVAIGHGHCSKCGTELAVIENALATAMAEEARAEALRTVSAIESGEQLVVANDDGSFQCPVCEHGGRLQTLSGQAGPNSH